MNKGVVITKLITAAAVYLLTVIGLIHTGISYVNIRVDISTGFPASVALLLLIPYGIGIAASLLTGFLVLRRLRRDI